MFVPPALILLISLTVMAVIVSLGNCAITVADLVGNISKSPRSNSSNPISKYSASPSAVRQQKKKKPATEEEPDLSSPPEIDFEITSAEHALYQKLLGSGKYQKHVRPVKRHAQPITVRLGMCVMMIDELIEREQIMVLTACIKMNWIDEFLVWNPDDFDNVTWMAVSSTALWLPDIAIINSPEPYSLTRKATNVDLSYQGEIGYFPSGRLATRCNFQITYFPFDWQNCEIRFESWIYPSRFLEIEIYRGETVDLKEYYVNHQWTVTGYRVLSERAEYDGKNFSSITFTFTLRRKSSFYFMFFVFPEFLLAALQTLSHTLPVEHPGRMTMLTALFISSSVTNTAIAAHIPKSSDTMSLLQIYLGIMSCNLMFALVVSFVMLYCVLRFPNEEPCTRAMLSAFFGIVWLPKQPTKSRTCPSISKKSSDKAEQEERFLQKSESKKADQRKADSSDDSKSAKEAEIIKRRLPGVGGDDLKRRWLLYCVAIDKCIMYANGVWNIALPIALFGIVPVIHETVLAPQLNR